MQLFATMPVAPGDVDPDPQIPATVLTIPPDALHWLPYKVRQGPPPNALTLTFASATGADNVDVQVWAIIPDSIPDVSLRILGPSSPFKPSVGMEFALAGTVNVKSNELSIIKEFPAYGPFYFRVVATSIAAPVTMRMGCEAL